MKTLREIKDLCEIDIKNIKNTHDMISDEMGNTLYSFMIISELFKMLGDDKTAKELSNYIDLLKGQYLLSLQES